MKTIDKWEVRTETFSDDESVSVYYNEIFLSHDETKSEALDEAAVILNAVANGSTWAVQEFPDLVRELQRRK